MKADGTADYVNDEWKELEALIGALQPAQEATVPLDLAGLTIPLEPAAQLICKHCKSGVPLLRKHPLHPDQGIHWWHVKDGYIDCRAARLRDFAETLA